MKVIKLNRRYKYYQHGFTHAIKFPEWTSMSRQVESFLINQYGPEPWTTKEKIQHPWIGGYQFHTKRPHPFMFYVKNEAVITLILLAIEHVKV